MPEQGARGNSPHMKQHALKQRTKSRVTRADGHPTVTTSDKLLGSGLTAAGPSCRDDLLRQAGSLGGIVNPGSNQTVFQATVPDNALRAGLAQIPRGQARPTLS